MCVSFNQIVFCRQHRANVKIKDLFCLSSVDVVVGADRLMKGVGRLSGFAVDTGKLFSV